MSKLLFMQMFDEVIVQKTTARIHFYYHPGLIVESNGKRLTYASYIRHQERLFVSNAAYEVKYDDDAWIEGLERVAARLWVTTRRPHSNPVVVETIVIASYESERIRHLWELSWPPVIRRRASGPEQERAAGKAEKGYAFSKSSPP